MNEATNMAVSVKDITKIYSNGAVGVDSLSLDIPRGQIIGLLGPNGSGKTTTVNLLTASFPPSSGSGSVLGYDINRQPQEIRRCISLVPQYESIDWSLTVYQNLKVFSELLSGQRADTLIDELLEHMELFDHRDTEMEGLSGGQIRRVQLARAMLFESPLCFVDEPTVGLDPVGTAKVLRYLKEQTRKGKTVVLATNVMSEMEQVCDRIVFLSKGRILYDGTPADIVKRCELTERVVLELKEEPSADFITALNGAGLVIQNRTPLTVSGSQAGTVVMPILAQSERYDVVIEGIRILSPTLEDAFVYIADKGGLG